MTDQRVLEVMISYRRSPHDALAEALFQAMLDDPQGRFCPLRDAHIEGGEEFQTTIAGWLARCDVALLLLSEATIDSPWVRHELSVLTHRRLHCGDLTILPVYLDGLTPERLGSLPAAAPLALASIQALDRDGRTIDVVTANESVISTIVARTLAALGRIPVSRRDELDRLMNFAEVGFRAFVDGRSGLMENFIDALLDGDGRSRDRLISRWADLKDDGSRARQRAAAEQWCATALRPDALQIDNALAALELEGKFEDTTANVASTVQTLLDLHGVFATFEPRWSAEFRARLDDVARDGDVAPVIVFPIAATSPTATMRAVDATLRAAYVSAAQQALQPGVVATQASSPPSALLPAAPPTRMPVRPAVGFEGADIGRNLLAELQGETTVKKAKRLRQLGKPGSVVVVVPPGDATFSPDDFGELRTFLTGFGVLAVSVCSTRTMSAEVKRWSASGSSGGLGEVEDAMWVTIVAAQLAAIAHRKQYVIMYGLHEAA